MINLPVKVFIGAAAAGAAGLGGYGIYSISARTKTIEEVLNLEGMEILSFDDGDSDTEWNKKIEEHGREGATLKFSDYEITSGDQNQKANRDKFKNICKELIKLSSWEGGQLDQAKKWCTKSK